ncbi:MAG: hypothetical protein KDI05_05505 [Halieaceae bacterium]|nr:hypothetical protein [Halieaceae bacterium]MCP5204912.1 hypothetical protein [Pseudomonadales bacterium]
MERSAIKNLIRILLLGVALACWAQVPLAQGVAGAPPPAPAAIPPQLRLLAPPPVDGPVVVYPRFELHDINRISDVDETFEFTGVLTLVWNDPRVAFTPADGVDELVFQGNYQFDEVGTGWYPTVVLANESGMFEVSGVVLRVLPDGTCTLVQSINATAEVDMDMRLFPFDSHRLEAVFEILGFDRDEVRFELAAGAENTFLESGASLPHWAVTGLTITTRDGPSAYAGRGVNSSALVVGVEVKRNSFYIRQLVSFPLIIIVLLSFSVFWMERSSLGDRTSVSFIGILTGVSYQLVMGAVMPEISYFTLMHAFLIISFLTMCATVVINLWVGALDKKGHHELGDRIDRRCRWIFPLLYFASMVCLYVGTGVSL